jgi:hypothetical protein
MTSSEKAPQPRGGGAQDAAIGSPVSGTGPTGERIHAPPRSQRETIQRGSTIAPPTSPRK